MKLFIILGLVTLTFTLSCGVKGPPQPPLDARPPVQPTTEPVDAYRVPPEPEPAPEPEITKKKKKKRSRHLRRKTTKKSIKKSGTSTSEEE